MRDETAQAIVKEICDVLGVTGDNEHLVRYNIIGKVKANKERASRYAELSHRIAVAARDGGFWE